MPALGKLLAEGRTAQVFAWDDHKVVKVYFDWCPVEWIDFEAKINAAVHDAGAPAPAVDGIVNIEGKRGIVFERVEGPTLLERFKSSPDQAETLGRELANVQFQIHQLSFDWLQPLKGGLSYAIDETPWATAAQKTAAHQQLEQLAEGSQVCHGDFHPLNVIATARGPIVIDWMTARRGHPIADVARTYMILHLGKLPPENPLSQYIEQIRTKFHQAYIEEYLALSGASNEDVEAWMLPILVARTNERIENERGRLKEMISTRC